MSSNSQSEKSLGFPEGKELESVHEVLKNLGILEFKLELSEGSKKGDNYMGTIYRVIANSDDKIQKREFLILKCSKRGTKFSEVAPSREAFLREIYLYDTILPEYTRFQELKNIPKSEMFNQFPKCYKTCSESNDEFLIFEDLRELKFTMRDRKETLNLSHCKFVIEHLAKYHAISFAYKDQNPEKFKDMTKDCKDIILSCMFSTDKEELEEMMDKFNEAVVANSSRTLEDDKEYLDKFIQFLDSKDYDVLRISMLDRLEKYTVLSHGDSWNNNILFKYKQDDTSESTPIDIRFLDWQVSSLTSPVIDLSYFIYNCTDKNLRDADFETLLEYYYETLATFIRKLGSDPEKVYPYFAYRASLKKYFRYAVIMAMFTIQMFTSEVDEVPDFEECGEGDIEQMSKMGSPEAKNYQLYKSRMSSIIKHAVDNGFI